MPLRSTRVLVIVALVIALAVSANAQELELRTIEFHSAAIDRTTKYNILLPRDYDASGDRYPVLYLLHGLTQNYTAWGLSNGAPFYGGLYDDLIVVMPDAGNSWYTNWEKSEDGQKNNWADHIVQDVVNHVDWNYRTIARREGRAITGLSMGGYGALILGLRNPDMFIAIGTTSGALEYGRGAASRLRGETPARTPRQLTPEQRAAYDERRRRPNPLIGLEGFSSQIERTPEGEMHVTAEHADRFDIFALLEEVPQEELPHIYIDCGTEDRLIAGAKELAGILIEKGVPFDYMQMGGGHNSRYWIQAIGHIMSVQYEVMQRALGQRPIGIRRSGR